MIYSFIIRNARRFVRSNALPSRVFSALRQAGADAIQCAHDYESADALQQCAQGYDIAARTEARQVEPEDESNARQRQRNAEEPATLAQVEAAFLRLMA